MLPGLLLVMFVTLYPIVFAVNYSLMRTQVFKQLAFVGLANYARLFADPRFQTNLVNSLFFVLVGVALTWTFGLALALLLRRQSWGNAILKTIVLIPWVTNQVVLALMWKWLLNPSSGLVNWALGLAGISGPGWWTDPGWAMPSIVLASAWKDLGFVMVIFLAGLQAIPTDYYEAAAIDGAGRWARFRHVTLPLLSPATFFVVIISLINSFQVFDQVWIMTEGGPAGASSVVVTEVVRNAFSYGRLGYASAMSWVLFVAILAVTLLQFRLQKRWVTYA